MKTANGKFGFGMARLPFEQRRGGRVSIDTAMLDEMVDRFIAGGFNYFDVARTYCGGACEAAVRRSLVERYPRESFILADKLPTPLLKSAEDAERIFAEQLADCGVEWFDRYIIHCATAAMCERAEQYRCFDFVERKKKEGKVQATGFSYHDSPELLDWLLKLHPEVDFVQLQISYMDWDDSPIQARRCYEIARRHGKQIVAMSPLKGGLLAGVPREVESMMRDVRPDASPAEWAMRYVASLEGVTTVLSGMSTVDEVAATCNFMRHAEPLNDAEHAIVEKAARLILRATPVQCTKCGYCVPGCPEKIDIPTLLSLFNSETANAGAGHDGRAEQYRMATDGRGKASDCTACGRCEASCPQHLHIIDALRKTAPVYECECEAV